MKKSKRGLRRDGVRGREAQKEVLLVEEEEEEGEGA